MSTLRPDPDPVVVVERFDPAVYPVPCDPLIFVNPVTAPAGLEVIPVTVNCAPDPPVWTTVIISPRA